MTRRVRGIDRKKIALNHKGLLIYQKIKFVFYVPPDYGLGDFLLGMGVKQNKGFFEKVWKIIIFAMIVRCEGEDVLKRLPSKDYGRLLECNICEGSTIGHLKCYNKISRKCLLKIVWQSLKFR